MNSSNDYPYLSCQGVGPCPKPWPQGEQYDLELLANGDSRNVIDRYRYWSVEAIVDDLDRRRYPFEVAIENWQHDMNIGSIVRSANAFAAARVHIIGRKRWNRRGAMVTDRYQHVEHHADLDSFINSLAGKPLIAVDNVPGSLPVERFNFPRDCVMIFGQEGPGLSQEALSKATHTIEITQYGSTRSINAASAAAIIMHSWLRQHA